jgi:hypothetical protein
MPADQNAFQEAAQVMGLSTREDAHNGRLRDVLEVGEVFVLSALPGDRFSLRRWRFAPWRILVVAARLCDFENPPAEVSAHWSCRAWRPPGYMYPFDFSGGRDRTRTCDLLRVKQAL